MRVGTKVVDDYRDFGHLNGGIRGADAAEAIHRLGLVPHLRRGWRRGGVSLRRGGSIEILFVPWSAEGSGKRRLCLAK